MENTEALVLELAESLKDTFDIGEVYTSFHEKGFKFVSTERLVEFLKPFLERAADIPN